MLRRLASLVTLKAFLKDTRGVSAIEFAFVAPILITAYLGLAELTLGMMAARRASHLAATVGDLAAQSDNLSAANRTDLFAIGSSMMQPFSTTGTVLKIRLSDVKMGTDGKALVVWSDASNQTKYATGYVVTSITTDQIAAGESLIMTQVEYDYDSPLTNFLPATSIFNDTFYHHPRNGAEVTNVG